VEVLFFIVNKILVVGDDDTTIPPAPYHLCGFVERKNSDVM
jgi:hypothetical protein